jgi:hypothetical protein
MQRINKGEQIVKNASIWRARAEMIDFCHPCSLGIDLFELINIKRQVVNP